jgi:hypothetical protein
MGKSNDVDPYKCIGLSIHLPDKVRLMHKPYTQKYRIDIVCVVTDKIKEQHPVTHSNKADEVYNQIIKKLTTN